MAVRIKTLKIPIIVTAVFVLSSLMPIIQILLMTFDGGLLAIVNKLLFEDKPVKVDTTNWIVNFTLSVLFLVLFCRTSSMAGKVTSSILAFSFLFCFFAFLTGDKYGETNPYFLYFMLVSLVSGLILCVTAILKNKVQQA